MIRQVLANFALVQPSVTDAPKIAKAIADVIGGKAPNQEELAKLAYPNRKNMTQRKQPNRSQVAADFAPVGDLLRSVMGPSAVLEPALLRPVPAKSMLRRMLTNLKLIYLRLGQLGEALACMDRILLLAPEEPQELRDRGLLHYQLDRYAEARADLERFLALMPQHPGADAVQPYLERARQRMSRLN